MITTTGRVLVINQGRERWVNPTDLAIWQNSGWTIVDTLVDTKAPEPEISAVLKPIKLQTEEEPSQNTNKENE